MPILNILLYLLKAPFLLIRWVLRNRMTTANIIMASFISYGIAGTLFYHTTSLHGGSILGFITIVAVLVVAAVFAILILYTFWSAGSPQKSRYDEGYRDGYNDGRSDD